MGRRTILMVVAIAVAALGSTLVFLYVQGINDRAIEDQNPVQVLTAKDNITAGESIEDAEAAGKLVLTDVPQANVLPGALTSVDALKGELALTNIFEGEQILPEKFGATSSSSTLTIPKPNIAISVQLNDPDRVAGFVVPGSKVAIFSCYQQAGLPEARKKELDDMGLTCEGVRMLMSDVEVIGVGSTSLLSTTTKDDSGTQTTEQIPQTILTLSLTKSDAEKIILASKNGDLTFGLMTDKSDVSGPDGVYADTVFQ